MKQTGRQHLFVSRSYVPIATTHLDLALRPTRRWLPLLRSCLLLLDITVRKDALDRVETERVLVHCPDDVEDPAGELEAGGDEESCCSRIDAGAEGEKTDDEGDGSADNV